MRNKQKVINLYADNSIRSIKHVVSIGDEEDLNQFWDYFHSEVATEYDLLFHFISMMYAFISRLYDKNKDLFFELIIEQNDEYFYFTLWNTEVSTALRELLEHTENRFEYKRDKKRITIKLIKEQLLKHDENYNDEQKDRRQHLLDSVVNKNPFIYPVYNFLKNEDKEEVLKICEDMSDIMYHSKKVGLNNDVFIALRSRLSMFALSLKVYPQLYKITDLIIEFSVFIHFNKEKFKEFPAEHIAPIEGFIYNLDRWANTLFVSGGADLHFMNSSLRADLEMIKMLVEPQQFQEELATDEIFDF
jgi:hypothetical protein